MIMKLQSKYEKAIKEQINAMIQTSKDIDVLKRTKTNTSNQAYILNALQIACNNYKEIEEDLFIILESIVDKKYMEE